MAPVRLVKQLEAPTQFEDTCPVFWGWLCGEKNKLKKSWGRTAKGFAGGLVTCGQSSGEGTEQRTHQEQFEKHFLTENSKERCCVC